MRQSSAETETYIFKNSNIAASKSYFSDYLLN